MQFTVTFRATDGSMATEVVEATNRTDCFAQMKARGIAPLNVKEGGGRGKSGGYASSRAVASHPPKPSARGKGARSPSFVGKALLMAAVLILVAGWLWWWSGGTVASKPPKRPVSGTDATSVSKGEGERPLKGDKHGEDRPDGGNPIKGGALQKDVAPSAGTDGIGAPELPDSVDGTPDIPVPPPVFSNASDQILAMAVSADAHGMPPMPISHNIEAEFLASLKQEIVILDTDDESTRAMKEAVKAAREEMKRLIDSGMTVSQVLAEHQNLANENAKVRNDAMMELSELVRSGDIEGAKEYKRKINIALGQMGIEELTIPVTEEERAERAAARRERMLKKRAEQAKTAEARNGNVAVPAK